jgi:tRNA nucleotidyltransferase (CCA-adding enzyme)
MSILESITLDKEGRKELDDKIKRFLEKLKNKDIKFFVGGSYAKNTFLKDNLDVDVFARFNYKNYKYADISRELGKLLRSKFKRVETVHGSRDYFHIKFEGLTFEVVPVLKIRKAEMADNIMDVSPLHVKFVKRKSNKKLQDEIRLLKQFLKANHLYGAESYIKGFSGYVAELLVIYYRGFDNLIKAAREWKSEEVIHFGKDKEQVLSSMSKSKKHGPLIVVDPVQKDRNAAAALGKRNYGKFIKLCKAFNGSKNFFVKKEILMSKLRGYTILQIKPLDGKKDIVGAKLLSLLERMKREFKHYDFDIVDYGWKFEDEVYFWFKAKKLNRNKTHYGPKVKDKKNCIAFKKRWKNVKVEKGKLYSILKRKYLTLGDYSKYLMKQDWMKASVKDIKIYK